MLAKANRVVLAGDTPPADVRVLARALHGQPLSTGDTIEIAPKYLEEAEAVEFAVTDVDPGPSGLVGATTSFVTESGLTAVTRPAPATVPPPPPTLQLPCWPDSRPSSMY